MATEQDHVWAMLDDMLVFLSKRHVPTPKRTYKLDGGWTLAMDDLRRYVDNLTAERDALRAHVERLRGVLECIPVDLANAIEDGDAPVKLFLSLGMCKLIGESLAVTPAQSLAEVKAAALREVAKLMDPDGGCYEALMAEADRIEKEAA